MLAGIKGYSDHQPRRRASPSFIAPFWVMLLKWAPLWNTGNHNPLLIGLAQEFILGRRTLNWQ